MVKYLKVFFPGNRMFSEHVKRVCLKASSFAGALIDMLPNRRRCSFEARRLFYLVVEAIILDAAPIWHETTNFGPTRK